MGRAVEGAPDGLGLEQPRLAQMSGSQLLRLFQSEYFDAHLHMHYLLRMEQSGVQDYLVNELFKMTDDDIDFYLPQLCQIALLRYTSSSLHRFLLDKAAQSMHFALKTHWLVQSIVEDRTPELWESALAMVNACETAMVNSSSVRPAAVRCAPGTSRDRDGSDAERGPSTAQRAKSAPPDLRLSGGSSASGARSAAEGEASPPARHAGRRSATPPGLRREASKLLLPRLDEARDTPKELAMLGAAGKHAEDAGEAVPLLPEAAGRRPNIQVNAEETAAEPSAPSTPSSRRAALRHLAGLNQASSSDQKAQAFGLQGHLPHAYRELGEPVKGWAAGAAEEDGVEGEMRQFMLKQRRCDYFNTQSHLVSMIMQLSDALPQTQDKAERKACLNSTFQLLNRWLFDRRAYMALNNEGPLSLLGLHVPILRKHDTRQQVLRVRVDMCRIFSSATRAPFMLVYETANLDEVAGAEGDAVGAAQATGAARACQQATSSGDTVLLSRAVLDPLAACLAAELGGPDAAEQPPRETVWRLLLEQTPETWQQLRAEAPPLDPAPPRLPAPCARCRQMAAAKQAEGMATTLGAAAEGGAVDPALSVSPQCVPCKRNEQARKARDMIWGESWKDKVERVRQQSPFGRYKSWTLDAVVVKGADDLRQELLAAQVVKQFITIFQEAGLPLWLKEIQVLVTSSSSGIIEYISDSVSVDSMKKNSPGKSLAELFKVAFSDKLFEAKQNFIESCAAYSLVIWFLQVKDRHNGNLMMDSSGHVIHIDFGFMLSNSPGGNMAFEQSPFKLTQEFLDVMDGECSDQYEYFRTLVIRGFLEARKHMERIILPIRMMLVGSKMPCFREGPDWVLQTLYDRFFVNLTEEACIEKIVDLIDSSVNNWRTIQYDNYQRLVNGIL